MKHLKKVFVFAITFSMVFQSVAISAHSGGHHSYNGSSSKYYSHHGYGLHRHNNGVCPYQTSSGNILSKSQRNYKNYQRMLNKLGYHCGTADGCVDLKSKRAIRRFQTKNGLSVTGNLNKSTKNMICKRYNSKF